MAKHDDVVSARDSKQAAASLRGVSAGKSCTELL